MWKAICWSSQEQKQEQQAWGHSLRGWALLSPSGSFQGDGTASTWKLQGRDPALLQPPPHQDQIAHVLKQPQAAQTLTPTTWAENRVNNTACDGQLPQAITCSLAQRVGRDRVSEVAEQGKPKKPHHSPRRISLLLPIPQLSSGPPDLTCNTP